MYINCSIKLHCEHKKGHGFRHTSSSKKNSSETVMFYLIFFFSLEFLNNPSFTANSASECGSNTFHTSLRISFFVLVSLLNQHQFSGIFAIIFASHSDNCYTRGSGNDLKNKNILIAINNLLKSTYYKFKQVGNWYKSNHKMTNEIQKLSEQQRNFFFAAVVILGISLVVWIGSEWRA